LFIESTFICVSNVKLVEFRNSKFYFKIFIFLPILLHFLLCHPGSAAPLAPTPNYVCANSTSRKVQITCMKLATT